jgi:DNA-directed RNA polymerase subunit RPC12/RpoP
MQGTGAEGRMDVKKHVVSLEKLFHFRCCSCNQWWSVGDWKENKETTETTCPHCGTKAGIDTCKNDDLTFMASGKAMATFGANGSWDPFHRRHDWSINDGGYVCRDCGKWSAEKDYSVCNKGENHKISGSLDLKV